MMKGRAFVILLLSVPVFRCTAPAKMPLFPANSVVINPNYSGLFQLAFTARDTFLKLKDPADSLNEIGNFCWGSGSTDFGFKRIKNREKIAALSAVFVGMIEALNEEKRIVAVDNLEFISSPETVKRIQKGWIQSVGKNGGPDKEKLLRMKPDFILTYYIDQQGKNDYKPLSDQGIPVIYLQNFLEAHPLGRAEWILVMGAITGHYSQARAMMDEIEEHYLSTVARVDPKYKPTVLVNAPFSGVWDVPAAESYMAKLITDAGGKYVFDEIKGTGRSPKDIESVFRRGKDAEIWMNPGACRDMACLLMMDKRLALFKSFKNGNIYNCTRLLKPNGANAWWDYGVLRPDLVLLDLFSIFHPEIEFQHEPVFFERLNQNGIEN